MEMFVENLSPLTSRHFFVDPKVATPIAAIASWHSSSTKSLVIDKNISRTVPFQIENLDSLHVIKCPYLVAALAHVLLAGITDFDRMVPDLFRQLLKIQGRLCGYRKHRMLRAQRCKVSWGVLYDPPEWPRRQHKPAELERQLKAARRPDRT